MILHGGVSMQSNINTRIEHIDRIRTAYIMYKDIPIATITEESSSLSGEFDWVINQYGIIRESVKTDMVSI